jgi:hypothetical protein
MPRLPGGLLRYYREGWSTTTSQLITRNPGIRFGAALLTSAQVACTDKDRWYGECACIKRAFPKGNLRQAVAAMLRPIPLLYVQISPHGGNSTEKPHFMYRLAQGWRGLQLRGIAQTFAHVVVLRPDAARESANLNPRRVPTLTTLRMLSVSNPSRGSEPDAPTAPHMRQHKHDCVAQHYQLKPHRSKRALPQTRLGLRHVRRRQPNPRFSREHRVSLNHMTVPPRSLACNPQSLNLWVWPYFDESLWCTAASLRVGSSAVRCPRLPVGFTGRWEAADCLRKDAMKECAALRLFAAMRRELSVGTLDSRHVFADLLVNRREEYTWMTSRSNASSCVVAELSTRRP